MLNRYTLAGLVCTFLMTSADASAQIFRRRATTTYSTSYTSYCPTYTPEVAPSTPVSALTAEEENELAQMIAEGWVKPAEIVAFIDEYKNATAEARKGAYEKFKQGTVTLPTTAELKQLGEMLKATGKKGGLDDEQVPAYFALTPGERKQLYSEFQAHVTPPSAEELARWVEMVEAGKEKGGYAAENLKQYLEAKSDARKKMYDDFKKKQATATGG